MKIFLLFLFLQGISAFSQEDNAFVSDTSFYPVKHNKAWYFMDTSGTVHEEKPNYSSVYPVYFFAEVYYVVHENGKYGMLQQNLEQFQEIKYDTIISSPYYLLLKDGKTWTHYLFNESIIMEADSVFQDGENVYYYNNGKTGLIANNILICKPEYECIASMNTFKGFFLTYQAGKFGLINQKGEMILPAAYAEIQEFDYGFVKFRKNESWKYYNTLHKNTVDPAGKDIHFYNDQCWKIYNGDRSKSVLYLDGGKSNLSGNYDDYFLLGNGNVAVRKNGKIGLLDENGQLLIPPKYEQIETVDNDFYQYKQKDLWGFMDGHGKEITPAVYNHFLPAKNYDSRFYFVLKNGSCGLMTKAGKIIIPIEYDHIIHFNDFYLLQSDGRFGMANLEGKILSPCVYPAYDLVKGRNSSNLLSVFQQNNQFTAFSKYGKINVSPCHDFVYENDVLKCYGENYVEVYVLSADGKQEDYHRYDGIQSFTFDNSYSDWYRQGADHFDESYLEENQQNGLFGLRFLQKEGMAVASAFKYVRPTTFLNLYTAHEKIDNIRFDKLGSAALETSEGAYLMWTTEAAIQKDLIVNTEAFDISDRGTSSTASDMKMNRDFSMRWISPNNSSFTESKLVAEAIYMDQEEDYKRIYFGGKAELCALHESDLSATEYFHYMNQMRNFWFTDAASAKIFMDPRLGVRFTGGEWKVLRVTEYFDKKPKIEFKTDQSFHSFKQAFFSDQYLFEEKGSRNLKFVDIWNDTTRFEQLEKIERVESFGGEEAYVISQRTNLKGKIHTAYPDFVFEPDSEQTEYTDRWIISKKADKYGLRAPNGEMLVFHDFQEIKYLGEHWFGISSSQKNWLMINSRSGSFADSSFTSLGLFNNGFLPFTQENSSGLMDSKGFVIARCEKCKFEISGGLILMKETDRTVVSDDNGVVATLVQGEALLGSGFILSKDKRGLYQVKTIESDAVIPLKTLKMPEIYGECLIIQNGNYYSLMRRDGTIAAKKSDLYEKYSNGIIGFRFSKKWQFYNEIGTQVHVSGSVKNRIVQEDLLMLDEKEKPYFIDNSGKVYASDSLFKPIREKAKQQINTEYESLQPQANGYSLVQKAGKWGALDSAGKLVIPCIHSELSYLGNDEFSVSLNGKQTFANTALKLILPIQYDEIFIVSDEFYRVRNGNRFGYLRKDGTWLREME